MICILRLSILHHGQGSTNGHMTYMGSIHNVVAAVYSSS